MINFSDVHTTVTTTDVIDIFSHFIVCLCVRAFEIMKGRRHKLSSYSFTINFSVESLPPSDPAQKLLYKG
jgi:hypothetical protein